MFFYHFSLVGSSMMYDFFLFLHSWLRWVVFLLLVIIPFRSGLAYYKGAVFQAWDKFLNITLLGVAHIQFLIGLVLYFGLSPVAAEGLSHFSLSMKSAYLRYWTVEHIFSMFVVIALIQTGYSISKRGKTDNSKHKVIFITTLLALIILLAMHPWPHKVYGRPLFRIF